MFNRWRGRPEIRELQTTIARMEVEFRAWGKTAARRLDLAPAQLMAEIEARQKPIRELKMTVLRLKYPEFHRELNDE